MVKTTKKMVSVYWHHLIFVVKDSSLMNTMLTMIKSSVDNIYTCYQVMLSNVLFIDLLEKNPHYQEYSSKCL